jgi:hypothetical protein
MSSRNALLVLVLAIFIVGIAACSSNSDEPGLAASAVVDPTSSSTAATRVNPANTPSDPPGDDPPAGIAIGERPPGFSPEKLPLQKITFSITTPSNTPTDEPIYLAITALPGAPLQHVEMKTSR